MQTPILDTSPFQVKKALIVNQLQTGEGSQSQFEHKLDERIM